MRKIVRFTVKSLAAMFAVLAVTLVLGVWWFASKPLDSRNFTPYVQAAFTYLIPQTKAQIQQTSLAWDNRGQTLRLSCTGVEVFDSYGSKVSSFPHLDLKVNIWSFLRGRFLPLEMNSQEARFWLTRNRKGSLSLGGYTRSGEDSGEGIDLRPLLADMADELANESLRQRVDIRNVKLYLRDARTDKKAMIKVPEISLNHDAKESVGLAKVEFGTDERPIYIQADYNFDFKEKQHHASVSFQDIRPAALAREELKLRTLSVIDFPLTGNVAVAADRDLAVVDAVIDIEGGEGAIVHPDLWDAPRIIKKSHIKGGFDTEKNAWALRDVFMDFGTTKLTMKAEAKAPIKKSELWRHKRQDYAYWAKINLKNVPLDEFGSVWPKSIIPNPRLWIMSHMSKGAFTKGHIMLRGRMDWDDLEETTLDTGEGEIAAKGGTVQYMEGMPSIENVDAVARYTLKKMDVDIKKGKSGNLVLRPFTIKMTDFDKEIQRIVIPAKLAGPTRSVIQRLKGPPLGYADEFGLEPEDMGGTMDGQLTLTMPLLADLYLKDISVKAKAKLKDFSSLKLVEGFPIEEGDLEFTLNENGFGLEGPILLRRVPLNLSWLTSFNKRAHVKEPLHQALLVGSVEGGAWDESGIVPDIHYEGVMPLTVRYAQTEDGFSTIDCEAGLTQADLSVGILNWKKPVGMSANVALSMELAENDVLNFSQIDLRGDKLNVQGTGELDLKSSAFQTLHLDPFVVGRSDGKLDIEKPTQDGGDVTTLISGNAFDATGVLADDKNEDEAKRKKAAVSYNLKTNTLYTSLTGFLKNASFVARRDNLGWDELQLKAIAQGRVPVSVSLKNEGKIKKLLIESDDFGVALKGLGLTESVEGGNLFIQGQSTPTHPRIINGEMKVKAFKVSDAPFLARLFSAISPFGFLDLITGDSRFDRMKAQFSLEGDHLTIKELQAPGSVAGINLKGKINLESGDANLKGTVVPFSFVNSILGSIPLLGDVITGGKGQGVIAASFKIKGPLSTADISVNPVSLLTPGFLRGLFFGGDVEETPAKTIKDGAKLKTKSVIKKGKK